MFLIGGPAYSGTTLLALMLNQPGVTCLNEPDFHDPAQSHNGLPVLQRLYPDKAFPERTGESLTLEQAFRLMDECQRIIDPDRLGVKFCNRPFVDFARLFKEAGLPVVAIVRDIRDALVRPLLPYVGGEQGLVGHYRLVWNNRDLYDAVVRYEDLIADTVRVTDTIAGVISASLAPCSSWDPSAVTGSMLYPRYRHYLLETGRVSPERVGIWKTCGKRFGARAHELAREMGYGP